MATVEGEEGEGTGDTCWESMFLLLSLLLGEKGVEGGFLGDDCVFGDTCCDCCSCCCCCALARLVL